MRIILLLSLHHTFPYLITASASVEETLKTIWEQGTSRSEGSGEDSELIEDFIQKRSDLIAARDFGINNLGLGIPSLFISDYPPILLLNTYQWLLKHAFSGTWNEVRKLLDFRSSRSIICLGFLAGIRRLEDFRNFIQGVLSSGYEADIREFFQVAARNSRLLHVDLFEVLLVNIVSCMRYAIPDSVFERMASIQR